MNIEELLRDDEPAILEEAWPAIATIEHYRRDGADRTRRRVQALYRHAARAVCARDLDDLFRRSDPGVRTRPAEEDVAPI